MIEENLNQELKLKNICERRNDFLKKIKQTELTSRKYKEVSTTLNYIEHFFILVSTITEYISISALASVFGIPIGITTSAIGLKFMQ